MRNIIILVMLFCFVSVSAQNKYFTENRNHIDYVGVKDAKGKVIIPAEMQNVSEIKNGETVTDKLLSFFGCPKNIQPEKEAWGCVFDRKGNYLYQAFAFDNGADYRVEGYQRIVKNGKIGFANRNGEIVIQPQFDFVTPFHYGYAQYCNGCRWENIDKEHRIVVGGQRGVINFRGEKITPQETPQHKNDVKIEGKYYPYPFSYSNKEQKILNFFRQRMKLLAGIEYANGYKYLEEKQKILYFEIVERPQNDFPFYVVGVYDYRKILKRTFWVTKSGKEVFFKNYSGKKIPFKEFLKNR